MAIAASPAFAQSASTEATVTIVRPLTLAKVSDMDFGAIAIGNAPGGQVTLNPATDVCTTSSAMALQGKCEAAEIAGYGAVLMRVRISVPQSTIVLKGPGKNIVVDNITLDTSPDLWVYSNRNRTVTALILTLNGVFQFRMGGRLTVNAAQAPGAYAGDVAVNIEYQ